MMSEDSSWHYQVMRHEMVDEDDPHTEDKEYYYELHEYYKLSDGSVHWTKNSIAASGCDYEDLIEELENMLNDAKTYGIRDGVTGELLTEEEQ